jgi:deferrochelatase/peroxidase EfeB
MTSLAPTPGAAPDARRAAPSTPTGRITPEDMHDIQGNVVRGYRMPNARHFALRINNGGTARRFVASLIPGSGGDGPHITTAAPWPGEKPSYCLNIGFTFGGLRAIGLPTSILQLFPPSCQAGPQGSATAMGDVGTSAPETWEMGGPANPQVHVILSLFSNEKREPCREHWTKVLEELFARDRIDAVWRIDADALPDGTVHFGYRDGIAQPRIEGVPGKDLPDMQPTAKPGEFLLGRNYENQYDGNFIGALPPELADNATYGAFRVLEQDVVGFQNFTQLVGKRYNMDPEMVAAKMMGRWRNGTPLTLSPEAPEPTRHPIAPNQINNFDFGPSDRHPQYFDDDIGLRCPVGAHIRRLNPRGSLVTGKPHTRRIIRRGIAFGPKYDPSVPEPDPPPRGLVGFFICGDLGMQFEFLQTTWVNADISTTGLRGTREALLGAQPDYGGQFVMRTSDTRDPIVFDNVPRFVQTRGSAYCLIPAIGGLRFLAGV